MPRTTSLQTNEPRRRAELRGFCRRATLNLVQVSKPRVHTASGQKLLFQAAPIEQNHTDKQNKYLAEHCIICKQYLPDSKSLKQHLRKKHPATTVPEAVLVQTNVEYCCRKVSTLSKTGKEQGLPCHCLCGNLSNLPCTTPQSMADLVVHRGDTLYSGHYQACLIQDQQMFVTDNIATRLLQQSEKADINKNSYLFLCVRSE